MWIPCHCLLTIFSTYCTLHFFLCLWYQCAVGWAFYYEKKTDMHLAGCKDCAKGVYESNLAVSARNGCNAALASAGDAWCCMADDGVVSPGCLQHSQVQTVLTLKYLLKTSAKDLENWEHALGGCWNWLKIWFIVIVCSFHTQINRLDASSCSQILQGWLVALKLLRSELKAVPCTAHFVGSGRGQL